MTLPTHKVTEMSLRLLGVVEVFPGLGKSMTWAVFRNWGIFLVSRTLLITLRSSCSLWSGRLRWAV